MLVVSVRTISQTYIVAAMEKGTLGVQHSRKCGDISLFTAPIFRPEQKRIIKIENRSKNMRDCYGPAYESQLVNGADGAPPIF